MRKKDELEMKIVRPENNVGIHYLKDWIMKKLDKKQEDVKIAICGPLATGKSYDGIEIGRVCDPNFNIERITWDASEFKQKVSGEEYPKGSVFLLEDFGIDMSDRQYQTKGISYLRFLLQESQSAGKGQIVIVTFEGWYYLKLKVRRLFDLILETDREEYGRAKPYISIEFPLDGDRVQLANLRDEDEKAIDYVKFDEPPDDFKKKYEKERSSHNRVQIAKSLKALKVPEKDIVRFLNDWEGGA